MSTTKLPAYQWDVTDGRIDVFFSKKAEDKFKFKFYPFHGEVQKIVEYDVIEPILNLIKRREVSPIFTETNARVERLEDGSYKLYLVFKEARSTDTPEVFDGEKGLFEKKDSEKLEQDGASIDCMEQEVPTTAISSSVQLDDPNPQEGDERLACMQVDEVPVEDCTWAESMGGGEGSGTSQILVNREQAQLIIQQANRTLELFATNNPKKQLGKLEEASTALYKYDKQYREMYSDLTEEERQEMKDRIEYYQDIIQRVNMNAPRVTVQDFIGVRMNFDTPPVEEFYIDRTDGKRYIRPDHSHLRQGGIDTLFRVLDCYTGTGVGLERRYLFYPDPEDLNKKEYRMCDMLYFTFDPPKFYTSSQSQEKRENLFQKIYDYCAEHIIAWKYGSIVGLSKPEACAAIGMEGKEADGMHAILFYYKIAD